jgi:hypothetical protein
MDFIILDVDNPKTEPVRMRFDMVQRMQYVLIDAKGNIVQRWFGPLNQSEVEAALTELNPPQATHLSGSG